jgi:hypothetical protein
LSITPSDKMPALIACWMLASVYSPPVQFRSVPARAEYACPPAAAGTCWPVAVLVHVVVPFRLEVVQPGGAQSWLPGRYVSPTAPQSEVVYPPKP